MITCPGGHLNPAARKYCGDCGLSLVGICPNGHKNPEGRRYCGECGSPLQAVEAADGPWPGLRPETSSAVPVTGDASTPGHPPPQSGPVGVETWFNRQRPWIQALGSAALFYLFLVSVSAFKNRWGTPAEPLAILVSMLCFLLVLSRVARTPRRRKKALVIGAISAAVGVIVDLMFLYGSEAMVALAPALFFTYPIGLVAAWSYARRPPEGWKLGLALAVPAIFGLQFWLSSHLSGWMLFWPLLVSVGCLICWGVGLVAARRSPSRSASRS